MNGRSPVNKDHYDILYEAGVTITPDRWEPIEIESDKAFKRDHGWRADFLWLGPGLLMRKSALDVVSDLLEGSGSLFPVKEVHGETLWLLNPRVVPALDESESDAMRFPDGRIMYVHTPVIIESATEGLHVFKVFHK